MRRVIVGVAVLTLCGCAREVPATRLEADLGLVSLPTCTRVSKEALGRLPLEVEVGGKTVRLAEWTVADETSTAVVGFAAQLPAGVKFTVQAGEQTFTGQGARWLHPQGVSGPRVHPIDVLTFCTQSSRPTLALAH